MKQLFEEFPEIKDEDWIAKVNTELKGNPANYTWNYEIEINPLSRNSEKLPQNSNENNNWVICQEINAEKPENINFEMHEALLGGASGISLTISFNWAKSDFEIIFKGISLPFIHLRLQLSKNIDVDVFLSEFETYLTENKIENANVSFAFNSTNNLSFINQNVRLEIQEETNDLLSERLAEMLIFAEKSVFELKNNICFVLNAEENFYVNIAKIKALNIIWQKILTANSVKIDNNNSLIFVIIKKVIEDPNLQVIAYNNMILSTSIGGASLIQAQNLNYENNAFAARITRNIQLILQEEGFINSVVDAAQGSYLVDNICKSIIDKTWDLFLKNIE